MSSRKNGVVAIASMVVFLGACAWMGRTWTPSEESLLERLEARESPVDECRAWNALAQRGYWIDRPTSETRQALAEGSDELNAFVRSAWPWLLRKKRPPR